MQAREIVVLPGNRALGLLKVTLRIGWHWHVNSRWFCPRLARLKNYKSTQVSRSSVFTETGQTAAHAPAVSKLNNG
jgi:hypothetical protein